jgi:hypothetical protein
MNYPSHLFLRLLAVSFLTSLIAVLVVIVIGNLTITVEPGTSDMAAGFMVFLLAITALLITSLFTIFIYTRILITRYALAVKNFSLYYWLLAVSMSVVIPIPFISAPFAAWLLINNSKSRAIPPSESVSLPKPPQQAT